MNKANKYAVHPSAILGIALRITVTQLCVMSSFFIIWNGFTFGGLLLAACFFVVATFLTMTFVGDLLTIVFNCSVHVAVQEHIEKDIS